MITIKGKEVMVKCSKNHCYRMTDEYVRDIHNYNNSGMYVFEDRGDQDQVLMDDGILNDLTGILSKSLTLNSCVKGECKKTFGLIRYNGGNSIAKYNPNVTPIISLDSFVECKPSPDGDNDVGKVNRNMDFCEAAGSSKAITGVGLIYIGNVDNGNDSVYTVKCNFESFNFLLCKEGPIKGINCTYDSRGYHCETGNPTSLCKGNSVDGYFCPGDEGVQMHLYQRTGANVVGAALSGNYVYYDETSSVWKVLSCGAK